jgi:hypothetical protein
MLKVKLSADMTISYEYFVTADTRTRTILVARAHWEEINGTPLGKYISEPDGKKHILVAAPCGSIIKSNSYLLTTKFSVLRSAFASNEEFVADTKRHFEIGESAFFCDKRVHTWGIK